MQNPTVHPLKRFLFSFRFRLTLLFVAILAVMLATFSVLIYTLQAQTIRTETTNVLISQSGQIATYYSALIHQQLENEDGESEDDVLSRSAPPLLQAHEYMVVIDPQAKIVQNIGNLSNPDLAAILDRYNNSVQPNTPIRYLLSASQSDTEMTRSEAIFIVSELDPDDDWKGLLVLGSSVDPAHQLPRLAWTLGLVSVLVILLAFIGGYWLANRALKPVEAITRTARRIGEGDLNHRLNLGRQDELGELADTFDQMLSRLQSAFDRQRQFTADASHELRTPLAIIELESSRTLQHRRTIEEYEKTLRIIQSENEQMGRLVNELLTLARMDGKQTSMVKQEIDLCDIVLDVLERMTPLALKKSVKLETGSMSEAPVYGDAGYLSQMLTNLVGNAIKYSRAEGPQVVLETGSQNWQGRLLSWLKVVDNGPGIAPEHQKQLFDRFFRVDSARRSENNAGERSDSGTGLGLAIVQSIVQAHGGTIDIKSQVGMGTTFIIWLPARKN